VASTSLSAASTAASNSFLAASFALLHPLTNQHLTSGPSFIPGRRFSWDDILAAPRRFAGQKIITTAVTPGPAEILVWPVETIFQGRLRFS
jgi:hypothetical protein